MNNHQRKYVLIVSTLVSLLFLWNVIPHADKPSYFLFADNVTCLGILNCFDVLSNLAFLLVSFYGFYILKVNNSLPFSYQTSLTIITTGAFLTSFGSMYFHLSPNTETLFWDRMPMTIGFSGVVITMLVDRLGIQRYFLAIAISIVIMSLSTVVGWHLQWFSLRPYLIVQYGCLIFTFLTLLLTKSQWIQSSKIFFALSFYVLAKIVEAFDRAIFEFTNEFVSGHTLKHLLAAVAIAFILHQFRKSFSKSS